VHRGKELFIVPGGSSRLAPEDWEKIMAELENAAGNETGTYLVFNFAMIYDN
jgi:hypothetical protein